MKTEKLCVLEEDCVSLLFADMEVLILLGVGVGMVIGELSIIVSVIEVAYYLILAYGDTNKID